jgi:hypothetical protein
MGLASDRIVSIFRSQLVAIVTASYFSRTEAITPVRIAQARSGNSPTGQRNCPVFGSFDSLHRGSIWQAITSVVRSRLLLRAAQAGASFVRLDPAIHQSIAPWIAP